MLRKKQDYFHTDTKVVCIIDFDKSGDEEITNMVNEIANNKRKKGYQVKTIICRGENPGDVIKIAGILKLIPEDTTQLIIAAHSRFYTRDGAVAPIKPYSKNEDVRHIGEYQLAEVASFLSKILLKREYINEIKFYSCETAVNKTTYDPKTYSKLIPKPVDAKTEKNIKENEKADPENIKRATNNSGYQGMKKSQELFKNNINLNIMEKEKNTAKKEMQKNTNDKISVRIKQFTLTNENFKELMALKEKGKFDLLSNIQIVMLDVYNNVFPKMERIIHFQGVNGVGFFDAKTSRKMKSFYQKDLEYKEDPDFEKKYVDKKDTVDKIDYQFTLGEKMNLETSNLSSSQSQSSSSGQQSPRKKRNLKY